LVIKPVKTQTPLAGTAYSKILLANPEQDKWSEQEVKP
jgi:hypothetical protein